MNAPLPETTTATIDLLATQPIDLTEMRRLLTD